MITINEAQQYLKDKLYDEGAICPCCKQFVKAYKRRITSSMVMGLILLYKESLLYKEWGGFSEDWIHIEDFLKEKNIPSSIRGDISKFKYWKILEPKIAQRDDKSFRNGYYRITPKGESFVRGTMEVEEYLHIYNDLVIAKSDNLVTIRDCIKNKFNYDELMQNY